MDPQHRRAVALAAAGAVRAAAPGQLGSALVGFDGFIDYILDAVDTRPDMSRYERIRTIGAFAGRVAAAAGRSTNIELVDRERRWGGNGPLLAGALGKLGMAVTFIGAVGAPGDRTALDRIYEPLERSCLRVVPIAAAGRTDAVEFDDGKLMFNRTAAVQDVTWERVLERVPLEALVGLAGKASIVGVMNWSLLGGVPGIWRGLIDQVLPRIDPGSRPRVFIDLSDPAKRTDEDLGDAMALLGEMNGLAPVTLGLNGAEAERIARVAGREGAGGAEEVAAGLVSVLGLDCVVVHRHDGAGAAGAGGGPVWFDGPYTAKPRISTGAGDHFNAGFALGQALGLPLDQCLALGCAVGGAYVRDAAAPDRERLCGLLRDLPPPERRGGRDGAAQV